MSVFSNYLDLASIPSPGANPAGPKSTPAGDTSNLADPTSTPSQNLSFADFLSSINPLQHIPVVGSIYRAVTGDIPPPAALVVGGALLGGPMGLIASAANAGLEQATGRDIGDRALALLSPSHTAAGTPQYAELASPGAPAGPVAAAAPTAVPNDTGSAGNSLAEAPPGPAGSAQVAAADAKDGADASVAPLSRALAGVAQPPSPAAALGARPGMLGSTAQAASKGWMLADYRAAAGHGLPVNTANNVSLRSAPIPLQTTVPLVSDMTRTPVVAATAGQPVAAAAASASPESVGSDNWISQAMLRGLDRYREMKKAEDAGPPAQSQRDGTF